MNDEPQLKKKVIDPWQDPAETQPRIEAFRGPHRWLSNFHEQPIDVTLPDDSIMTFPSVEYAYQYFKQGTETGQLAVLRARTPGAAKRASNYYAKESAWSDASKLGVMVHLSWIKYDIPAMETKLLNTHPAALIEGNTWNDRFFGVCDGHGFNYLGRILMAIRDAKRRKALTEQSVLTTMQIWGVEVLPWVSFCRMRSLKTYKQLPEKGK